MATNNSPLRSHYGYKLRSGRRVLGTIKPAAMRNVYSWQSNFTKYLRRLPSEAPGMWPRQCRGSSVNRGLFLSRFL